MRCLLLLFLVSPAHAWYGCHRDDYECYQDFVEPEDPEYYLPWNVGSLPDQLDEVRKIPQAADSEE
jgi:hypothetical protein